ERGPPAGVSFAGCTVAVSAMSSRWRPADGEAATACRILGDCPDWGRLSVTAGTAGTALLRYRRDGDSTGASALRALVIGHWSLGLNPAWCSARRSPGLPAGAGCAPPYLGTGGHRLG